MYVKALPPLKENNSGASDVDSLMLGLWFFAQLGAFSLAKWFLFIVAPPSPTSDRLIVTLSYAA